MRVNYNSSIRVRILKLLLLSFLIFFIKNISIAQNTESLFDRGQKQAEFNMYHHSPVWDKIQQLKMLRDNSPSQASFYNQQINQILQNYTLNTNNPSQEIVEQQNKNPFQPKFEDPDKNNKNKNPINSANNKNEEGDFLQYLNKISSINQNMNRNGYYNSPEFKNDLANYQTAFDKLKNMLEDKTPLSLTDALYIEESAYGNLQMDYKEYKQNIAESVAFIREWMAENGLSIKNPEAIHLAIQKFMGDTLSIKRKSPDNNSALGTKSHLPFVYDYVDYRAEKDLHNYFLTKTLATGAGQCNTLPRVYLVLAEALGVNAYLTFAPQHSFIKYKNNKGTIENYEPTIDWHMSDQDYTEQMPVMSSAIANKIYLSPLSKKQMIATIMIDLASNFERKHWIGDGTFINQCIDCAMNYFPNKIGNSEGLLLRNLLLASKLEKSLHDNNITNLNDIGKSQVASQVYKEFQDSENQLLDLGIQEFPESKYKAMLEKHDNRGKLQLARNIDTKSKKSLFFHR